MDEMKLKLGSRFMRNMVSKLITKMIYKKTGYKVNIQLNDLDVWMIDGDTNVKLSLEAKMNSEEFNKVIKNIGLD